MLNITGNHMLRFQANSFGFGTSGYWEIHLDGNSIGLSGNRISAHWIDPDSGDVFFTPRTSFSLDGQTYKVSDIVRCTPFVAGPIYDCALTRYWLGEEYGLSGLNIESIDLSQGLSISPPAGSITIVKTVTSGSGAFNFTGDLGSFALTVPGDTSRTFSNLNTRSYTVKELTPSGWQVNNITCTGDLDSGTVITDDNQVLIDLDQGEAITCTFTNGPEGVPIADTIYISPARPGKVNGINFNAADILKLPTNGQWEMFFKGSQLGISPAGIKGFSLMADGSLLLTLNKGTRLPGGVWAGTEDIVRFIPTIAGNYSSGTYQMYFDGSDVYLSGAAEAIDAFGFDASGRLIISTKGAATVKVSGVDVKARNQDLLAFTFNTIGDSTSGTWQFYFDGSDVGLGKENIDALWVDPLNGDLYLSVMDKFTAGGVSGSSGTVFICSPVSLGDTTSCTYSAYWDAASHGIKQNVNGLHIRR